MAMVKTKSAKLLRELFMRGKPVYTMKEITAAALVQKINPKSLRKMLARLTHQGRLLRLKRGLYATVLSIPEQTQVHPFAIGTQLVTPSAISNASALHYRGFIDEAPTSITLMTPRKVVTPSMRLKSDDSRDRKHAWEIDGLRYEFKTVKQKHFFGVEKIWLDERNNAYLTVPITNKERTILDAVINPTPLGGILNVLKIIEKALPSLDIKRLVDYALLYDKKATIKRLGFLLEKLNVSNEVLAPLLSSPIKHYCRLDPALPAKGPCHSRWMIQDNR